MVALGAGRPRRPPRRRPARAAPGVGRLAGADPQALVGLALVAFVGAWLWLAGAAILFRWTLRRGGWWYAASALLLAGLVRGVLSLLAPAGG